MKPPPRLITFGISHFCEKARWALDWHGIDYEEECWAPGLHIYLGRRAGVKGSALPILMLPDGPIQGSAEVVDWAEENGSGPSLEADEASEIEKRADAGLGVHIRLFVYSICLPHHPESVRPALYHDLSTSQRLLGKVTWPAIRRLMIKGFRIRPDTPAFARDKFEAEMDWLDELLSDGRPFLTGDRFSRADLTVASLLSPLTRPQQMAVYRSLHLPKEIDTAFAEWMERPCAKWAARLYETHRQPKTAGAETARQRR